MFEDFEDFEPIDFLYFSKELISLIDSLDSKPSTIKRVVYGRIYYATFLYVREWLKTYWRYNSTRKDHTQMLNFLRRYGPFNNIKNHKVADDLYRLKILRHQADYHITIPNEGTDEYNDWISESIEDTLELACYVINLFMDYDVSDL